ncbi:hypothetical protein V1506DRAFT_400894 [Lipomyces tetrasporus]
MVACESSNRTMRGNCNRAAHDCHCRQLPVPGQFPDSGSRILWFLCHLHFAAYYYYYYCWCWSSPDWQSLVLRVLLSFAGGEFCAVGSFCWAQVVMPSRSAKPVAYLSRSV